MIDISALLKLKLDAIVAIGLSEEGITGFNIGIIPVYGLYIIFGIISILIFSFVNICLILSIIIIIINNNNYKELNS